jgi:hypothetical protein
MSVVWAELGAQGQALAAEHFVSASLAGGLRDVRAAREADADATVVTRSLLPRFDELYEWITDPAMELPAEQLAAMEADPVLRHSVALLVGRVGQLCAVAAAAASSGELDQRSGTGFTLKLTVSRADPAQSYVTIEIDPAVLDPEAPPRLLLVLRGEMLIGRLALPEPADGVVQVMAASDSPELRGLRAADTELVLV